MNTNSLYHRLNNIDSLTVVDRFEDINGNLVCSKIIIKTKNNENIIIEPDEFNFLRVKYEQV